MEIVPCERVVQFGIGQAALVMRPSQGQQGIRSPGVLVEAPRHGHPRMIAFQLDPSPGVPAYVRLVQQVRQAMQLGVLEPGNRLPTAQQVVAWLAITPNTVLKAYRDLERGTGQSAS